MALEARQYRGVRHAINLIALLGSCALFFAIEAYQRGLHGAAPAPWRGDDIGYIVLLLVALRFVRSRLLTALPVIAAGLLQLIEIGYQQYTGVFFGPQDLSLFTHEYLDTLRAVPDVTRLAWGPITLVLAAQAALLALLLASAPYAYGPRTGYALLGLWALAPFIHAYTEDNAMRFTPDPGKSAFRNGANALAYFTVWDLAFQDARRSGRDYRPYVLRETALPEGGPFNVVVVMGESLTYPRFSLYGYQRQTTPFLDSLKGEPGLAFRPAVSSAVSTHVSIPMFFNVQYEPDNLRHLAKGESNLFALAKARGYQTAFVSAQQFQGVAGYVAQGKADHWLDAAQLEHAPGEFDERLLGALQRLPLDWQQPLFLAVNPRAGHIPYYEYYPQRFELFGNGAAEAVHRQRMSDAYDNALRYFDFFFELLVQLVEARTSHPTVFIITSDHGQRLGEGGFGHNTLELGSARVPFVVYAKDAPAALRARLEAMDCVVNHYQIGRLVAGLLGFELDNPNERDGVYHLNGVDLFGAGGHRGYRMADCAPQGQIISFMPQDRP